jgi:Rod binding domain-containing protein
MAIDPTQHRHELQRPAVADGAGAMRARAQDPAALRETARQFESVFTRMLLQSMRQASQGDALFDSQQSGFYRDMFDDQLSIELSRGGSGPGRDGYQCECQPRHGTRLA